VKRAFPTWTLIAAASLPASPATAQSFDVSGYALGVATSAGDAGALPGGTGFVGRMRVMPVADWGGLALEAAYEHVVTRTDQGGVSITSPGGGAESSDWLRLGWTVREDERTTWLHRFDRLALRFESGAFEITAGRQAISWATTLFMTPADPFSPFDPSDPFREYRGGVDALRIRTFPGPFSEMEFVLREAGRGAGRATTALVRGQTSVGGGAWSVGAWGGALHDEAAGAAFVTGSVGATALRAEAVVRQRPRGDRILRVSAGVDRFFRPADRDLYVVVEVQHDGFGASEPSDLLPIASSGPYRRGEMQTLGANTLAGQVSYQVHPLLSAAVLGLANLNDASALLSLSLAWSASERASVSVGGFLGSGRETLDPNAGFASEYGLVPGIAYASMSWFF